MPGRPSSRGPCHGPSRDGAYAAARFAPPPRLGSGLAATRRSGASVGFRPLSGALMANQLHIAHSAEIMGAAMIAGGLYGCAVLHATADGVEALDSQAAGPCVSTPFLLEGVSFYTDLVKTLAPGRNRPAVQSCPQQNLPLHRRRRLGCEFRRSKGRAVYAALGVPTPISSSRTTADRREEPGIPG